MHFHVLVLQDDSNYHFDVTCDRVPEVGELLLERNSAFKVKELMTFHKGGQGTTVLVVEHVDFDNERYLLMNELDSKVR